MSKRTNWDFSKFELTRQKDSLCEIFTFAKPNTIIGLTRFTMTPNGMLISGDFGMYSVSRNFYPAKGFKVSDGYFFEKMDSIQDIYEYSQDDTDEAIKAFIDEHINEYPDEKEKFYSFEFDTESEESALSDLDIHLLEYTEYHEIIQRRPKTHILCVLDAFEAMCEKM